MSNRSRNNLVPSKGFQVVAESSRKLSFMESQRQALGIPEMLQSKPVFYLSAHRGFFSAEFPQHMEEFSKALRGEDVIQDKEVSHFDLSTTNPQILLDVLYHFGRKIDHSSNDEGLLPSFKEAGRTSSPLPGFIINAIYLPSLDRTGRSMEGIGSHTFAIDATNYEHILKELAEFLKERGLLDNKQRLEVKTNEGLLQLSNPL